MDHDDLGIAINRRKIETDVVEDLDTATASKFWSWLLLLLSCTICFEGARHVKYRKKTESTKFIMSVGIMPSD